jgi:hypothetical protein
VDGRTWYYQSSLRPVRRFPGETGAVALLKPCCVVLCLWCEECVSDVLLMGSERRGCSGGDDTASEACSVDDECPCSCSMSIS